MFLLIGEDLGWDLFKTVTVCLWLMEDSGESEEERKLTGPPSSSLEGWRAGRGITAFLQGMAPWTRPKSSSSWAKPPYLLAYLYLTIVLLSYKISLSANKARADTSPEFISQNLKFL